MEELEKVIDNYYEENKEVAEPKYKTYKLPPELYCKAISIYNEFIRKYDVEDKEVDIKIVGKDGELDQDIYGLLRKDAQNLRSMENPLTAQEEYNKKLEALHALKVASYKDNIKNKNLVQSKERLLEIIKLEKDLGKLRTTNKEIIKIDNELETKYQKEENKFELYINDNLNQGLEKIPENNLKLDKIEAKAIDLNKKNKANEISRETYDKEMTDLEKEKVNIIWGLTVLNPNLIKEKHIQNIDEKQIAVKEKKPKDIDINEINHKEIKPKEEKREIENQNTGDSIFPRKIESEVTEDTVIRRKTIIEEIEENEFIMYLQTKVIVKQDPNKIVDIVRAQTLRDVEKENIREVSELSR